MNEQVAAADPSQPPSRRRAARQWLGDAGVSWLWALNGLLLCVLCVWIWNDVKFLQPAVYNWPMQGPKFAPQPPPEMTPMTSGRWLAFRILAVAAVASFAGIIVGLFIGAARHRSVRTWLAVIGLAAAWLWLATTWRDVAWAGRRWRAANLVEAFEPLASSLRDKWPTQDGATEELGPFAAYPTGKPRMLMPLTYRTPKGADEQFAAVERSPDGALRFDLEGRLADVWLEWHPPGSAPNSFVGGLDTQYDLERSHPLGDGWFATTYQSSLARRNKLNR